MAVYINVVLISALVGDEWSVSRSTRCTPGIHWVGGCVSPKTGLDDAERRASYPCQESNSDSSAVRHVASRYIDCAFPTRIKYFILWYYVAIFIKNGQAVESFDGLVQR
jgi:hypothetical protein